MAPADRAGAPAAAAAEAHPRHTARSERGAPPSIWRRGALGRQAARERIVFPAHSPVLRYERMRAPYSAKAVANFFLEKDNLTQMKLHKLLYYAHGWHLGFKGKPLFDDKIEAWEYGPVVPSIYRQFRDFGSRPIDELAGELSSSGGTRLRVQVSRVDPSDEEAQIILKRVWEVYGSRTAAQLSHMTHAQGAPWSETMAKHRGATNAVIPNKKIKSYFAKRVGDSRAATA